MSDKQKCTIQVYLDCGDVWEFDVCDTASGRKHAANIIEAGLGATREGSKDLEWFPPHTISKVKISGVEMGTKCRVRKCEKLDA